MVEGYVRRGEGEGGICEFWWMTMGRIVIYADADMIVVVDWSAGVVGKGLRCLADGSSVPVANLVLVVADEMLEVDTLLLLLTPTLQHSHA